MVGLCGMLCLFFTFQSCYRENPDGGLPVIEEELIGEYLAKDTLFSEFTRMLDTTGVIGLLNAYGMYTVFAPTNEAIHRYYRSLKDEEGNNTITSLNQLSMSEIREFCYNHIVKGDTLRTKYFKNGTLGPRSMSERFITISFKLDTIMINGVSPVLAKDIELHNGLIQVLGEAFSPAHVKVCEVFEADSARFGIYVDALKKTGLYTMMVEAKVVDETWDPKAGWPIQTKTEESHNPDIKPTSRKFGFTILAVSDADLKNCLYPNIPGLEDGIDNITELEALARYYYSRQYGDANSITDRKNRKHYLNRFMSYHCLDRVVTSSRFVKDYFTKHHIDSYPMPDYTSTMLENSLLETLCDKTGVKIGSVMATKPNSQFGVFNFDDPIQGAMLTDVRDLPYGGSMNGYYHGITKPIMYSKTLSNAFSSKRLRMDVASFLPELTTNNIRGSNSDKDATTADQLLIVQDNPKRCYVIDDSYVDGFYGSPNTRFKYVGISPKWEDYQGDEFYVTKQYNFTFETLPIPAGTYEVRMAYQITTSRAISQIYFDSLPCGIPLDLAIAANQPGIDYIKPGDDAEDPYGYENDKMMHNRGYMKGPVVYRASHAGGGKQSASSNARMSSEILRRVLGIYTFDNTEKHYFSTIYLGSSQTITGDPQFMIDYLEFTPLELLDKEGID
jgi:uncharacterized surface protein with fasciclin (FAS1) repeats